MPGSTPATSQLDWLSSTTAMIVLSWSKATRDLLKSFSWGIGALRQLFASDDGAISFAACPIPSRRWSKADSNHRSLSRGFAVIFGEEKGRQAISVVSGRLRFLGWTGGSNPLCSSGESSANDLPVRRGFEAQPISQYWPAPVPALELRFLPS